MRTAPGLTVKAKVTQLLTRTPRRTFVVYPLLVGVEQLLTGRRLRPLWSVLLVWGYLQYRLAGNYRTAHGGGGPGITIPPERIVTTGLYRCTRNPMYLGHLIFLAGLTGMTRSPLAAGLLAGNAWWFDRRASGDEEGLVQLFGDEYRAYRDRVPRWLPLPNAALGHGSTAKMHRSSSPHRRCAEPREGYIVGGE